MNTSIIIKIAIYFILYLATHVGIGLWTKKCEQDALGSNDQAMIKRAIRANMIFKWYPVAYIILILVTF